MRPAKRQAQRTIRPGGGSNGGADELYRMAVYAVLRDLHRQGAIDHFTWTAMELAATSDAARRLGVHLIETGLAVNAEAAAATIFGRRGFNWRTENDGPSPWEAACRLAMKNAGASDAESRRVVTQLEQEGGSPGWVATESSVFWGLPETTPPLTRVTSADTPEGSGSGLSEAERKKERAMERLFAAAVGITIVGGAFAVAAASGIGAQFAASLGGCVLLIAAGALAQAFSRLSSSTKYVPIRWAATAASVAMTLVILSVALAVLGWYLFSGNGVSCITPACRYD